MWILEQNVLGKPMKPLEAIREEGFAGFAQQQVAFEASHQLQVHEMLMQITKRQKMLLICDLDRHVPVVNLSFSPIGPLDFNYGLSNQVPLESQGFGQRDTFGMRVKLFSQKIQSPNHR
ncbi:hypothetical protein [Sulfitobacter pacificus]|uniref:hypothetical protein n=1 Tax=Sulfitobacter pacificus TaxID=1499314 RepID=UPI0024E11C0A|nr:hypothetical protein [Sulfitobacter pacificus]